MSNPVTWFLITEKDISPLIGKVGYLLSGTLLPTLVVVVLDIEKLKEAFCIAKFSA